MSNPEPNSPGPELLASLREVLAALERIDRKPTKDDAGKIRKALQMLDALSALGAAPRD